MTRTLQLKPPFTIAQAKPIVDFISQITHNPNSLQKSLDHFLGYKQSVFWDVTASEEMINPRPHNIGDSAMYQYCQYYQKYDYFSFENTPPNPLTPVIRIEDIVPLATYYNSVYYREYGEKYHVDRYMTRVLLYSQGLLKGVLVFCKSEDDAPYSEYDCMVLNLLAPIIGDIIAMEERYNSIHSENLLLKTIIDNDDSGIIMLDGNHRILSINRAAYDIINKVGVSNEIDEFVNGVLDESAGIKNLLYLAGYSISVNSRYSSPYNSDCHLAIIFKKEQPAHVPLNTNLMFEGLSPAEKNICFYLLQGHSYKEIAKTLYISNATVNKHANSIYNKMNVHNRAELQALYLRVISPALCIRQKNNAKES